MFKRVDYGWQEAVTSNNSSVQGQGTRGTKRSRYRNTITHLLNGITGNSLVNWKWSGVKGSQRSRITEKIGHSIGFQLLRKPQLC